MKTTFWKFYCVSEDEKGEIIIDVDPIYLNASFVESVIYDCGLAHIAMASGADYTVRVGDVVMFLKSFGANVSYGPGS